MARELFGGAMRCVIPPGLVDVSAFREVPDNQEVWVAQDSDALAMVVEVAEYAAEVADEQAASYYFSDLAECNEAQSFVLQAADARVSPAGLLQCPAVASVWACSGVQQGVSKFTERGQGNVAVWLAVARLPVCRADVLVSVTTRAQVQAEAQQMFALALQSLEIVDTALFAP